MELNAKLKLVLKIGESLGNVGRGKERLPRHGSGMKTQPIE